MKYYAVLPQEILTWQFCVNSQFLNEWIYIGYSQTSQDKKRFLIESEFKIVAFHKEENMNEMKRLEKITEKKLKPLMTHSLECQPRQEGVRIHKVGKYKTRFTGFQLKCNNAFEFTLCLGWTKHSQLKFMTKKQEDNTFLFTSQRASLVL